MYPRDTVETSNCEYINLIYRLLYIPETHYLPAVGLCGVCLVQAIFNTSNSYSHLRYSSYNINHFSFLFLYNLPTALYSILENFYVKGAYTRQINIMYLQSIISAAVEKRMLYQMFMI